MEAVDVGVQLVTSGAAAANAENHLAYSEGVFSRKARLVHDLPPNFPMKLENA
jgi:hypothetical protein